MELFGITFEKQDKTYRQTEAFRLEEIEDAINKIARPSGWVTYFEDFIVGGYVADDEAAGESSPSGGMFSEVADAGQYLVSLATTGEAATAAITDGDTGGWVKITTVGTQNHPVGIQANGTPWKLLDNKKLYFETKIKIEDVDQCKWFIGLSIANTDILASGAGTVDDIIGFAGLATTAIQFLSNEDDSDSINATAGTIADDTAVTLAFYWDGDSKVHYYIDNAYVNSMNVTDDNINQDEGMSVAFVIDNTEGGTAEVMEIDYIKVMAER